MKLDEITDIEIDDKGWVVITQFDNNEVILSPENVKKLKKKLTDYNE